MPQVGLSSLSPQAAAGHHFIEYTRRDALPRLERELALDGAAVGSAGDVRRLFAS